MVSFDPLATLGPGSPLLHFLSISSPFKLSPVVWLGLAGFNNPIYLGRCPFIFLTEYIKLNSYSPNEDSALIRQVTDLWFSKQARKQLHGIYGKKLAMADLARF